MHHADDSERNIHSVLRDLGQQPEQHGQTNISQSATKTGVSPSHCPTERHVTSQLVVQDITSSKSRQCGQRTWFGNLQPSTLDHPEEVKDESSDSALVFGFRCCSQNRARQVQTLLVGRRGILFRTSLT